MQNSSFMGSEQVYNKLKGMIYEGRLQPGQRLVERDLSKSLSVSRIPLRESLARLESEGLVRSIPNTATYVEDFSQADVLQIYSMRLILEPEGARLATLQAKPALVSRLKKFCDQMTEQSKKRDWAKLDRIDYQFHQEIMKASRHELLIRAYNNSHIQVTGTRSGYSTLSSLPPETTAMEHVAIISAVEGRNPKQAEAATREHIKRAMATLEKALGFTLESSLKNLRVRS